MRILQHDDHEAEEHGHEEHGSETEKSLTGIKVLIIVLLLLAGLFVFFPYSQVKPKKEGDKAEKKKECCKGRFFSISNCFAAGMLLSMALCHILPEAEGMYQALQLSKEKAAEASEILKVESHDDHEEHEGEEHEEGEVHEEGEEHEEEGHEEEGHEEEGHKEEEHDDHEGHEGHEEESTHGFPLVYVLFFGGFMLMLVLDQVIFKPS